MKGLCGGDSRHSKSGRYSARWPRRTPSCRNSEVAQSKQIQDTNQGRPSQKARRVGQPRQRARCVGHSPAVPLSASLRAPVAPDLKLHRPVSQDNRRNFGHAQCNPEYCSPMLASYPISGGCTEAKDCACPSTCPGCRLAQQFQQVHQLHRVIPIYDKSGFLPRF
jgi:hypothetical protein